MKIEDGYYGFVYETTNLLDNKKYIGKCVFKRLNGWQNYLGSGTYLTRAIKKHGRENFTRDILFLALDAEELEELEEFVIRFHDAPNNDNYYNLKFTSIGGDTITNNPNREARIKQMSVLTSGENNPMYGREKSEKFINSIKKANSKPIIVDGVEYESAAIYSALSGEMPTGIHYRLSSTGFPNYQYKNKSKKIEKAKMIRIAVQIDGIEYKSIYQASKKTGIFRSTIKIRLESEKYNNYQYI